MKNSAKSLISYSAFALIGLEFLILGNDINISFWFFGAAFVSVIYFETKQLFNE